MAVPRIWRQCGGWQYQGCDTSVVGDSTKDVTPTYCEWLSRILHKHAHDLWLSQGSDASVVGDSTKDVTPTYCEWLSGILHT